MSDVVAHMKFSARDTHAEIHLSIYMKHNFTKSTTNQKWMDVVVNNISFSAF